MYMSDLLYLQTGRPPPSSRAVHQKCIRKPTSSSSSSSSHPHPGPPSILLSDTITPWRGLALPESSFTSIPPPPIPQPPPSTPLSPPPTPTPQPSPSTPHHMRQNEDQNVFSFSFNSEVPSSPAGGGRTLQARKRVLPQRRVPHPPHLPPLRPITNLSFSRSFTFSFFELPVHHSPRCRADRIRNLMLLLRQIHY